MSNNNHQSDNKCNYCCIAIVTAILFAVLIIAILVVVKDNQCCSQYSNTYNPALLYANPDDKAYSRDRFLGIISIPADGKQTTGIIRIVNGSTDHSGEEEGHSIEENDDAYALPYKHTGQEMEIGQRVSFQSLVDREHLQAVNIQMITENSPIENTTRMLSNLNLAINLHNGEDQHADKAHRRFHMNRAIIRSDFNRPIDNELYTIIGQTEDERGQTEEDLPLRLNEIMKNKIIQSGTNFFYFKLLGESEDTVEVIGLTAAEVHNYN